MKKTLLSFLFFVQTFFLFAQDYDSLRYKSECQIRTSVGLCLPLTRLQKGTATDYLLEFDDRTFSWQISLAYFFHKHWGVEGNFQINTSKNMSKRSDKFFQVVQNEYSQDYYLIPPTLPYFKEINAIKKLSLGIIYRLEVRRFVFYPKFSIGITSFRSNQERIYLKQKNTNNVLKLDYLPTQGKNRGFKDPFMLATSALLGYKLKKWLFLNVDILLSHYKTNKNFTKTTTDLNTMQTTSEDIPYKKHIFNLTLGTGLIIAI